MQEQVTLRFFRHFSWHIRLHTIRVQGVYKVRTIRLHTIWGQCVYKVRTPKLYTIREQSVHKVRIAWVKH